MSAKPYEKCVTSQQLVNSEEVTVQQSDETRIAKEIVFKPTDLEKIPSDGTRKQYQKMFPLDFIKSEEATKLEGLSFNHSVARSSTPTKDVFEEGSSSDSSTLHIVLPASEKKKSDTIDITKEIEEDIQRELNRSKRTSLTVKKVKSILRYVIGNESVLAMVSKSMKSSGEDLEVEPKLTRSKARLLRKESQILWPLSPIQVTEPPDNEHLVLIREELPEEEDDDEYRPNIDDMVEPSDDESGRQSVGTPSLDLSAASRYLENFDPGLLDESAQDTENHCNPGTSDATFDFKKPEENIGQRTRSKLSLSSTPLEAIEQAFVPPDITTDMYDFKCDNLEWENFLKEFMQPLSNDTADGDEEDDPEYSVQGEEEELDKEELRRDRAVTVSKAELRTLMAELLGVGEEQSSDEEHTKEASVVPTLAEEKKDTTLLIESPMEACPSPELENEPEPEAEPSVIGMTRSQQQLLMQQIRQHVQLLTQHFLQTHWHPMFSKMASECKVLLVQLVELAKLNPNSVVNVFNLQKALKLVGDWETFLATDKGLEVILQIEKDMVLAQTAKKKSLLFWPSFHPKLMDYIAESEVFMYPALLPERPFRCDHPSSVDFVNPEDQLIAIGLEQLVPYMGKHPRWCDRKQGPDRIAADLLHELLLPGRSTMQIVRRIRRMKAVEGNSIWHYFKFRKAPRTIHYVIPFAFPNVLSPLEQRPELLPPCWRDYVDYAKQQNNP